MTKALFLILPVLALTACGNEPAPAPEPTPEVAPEPVSTLPAPDEDMFKTVFAEACPNAKPVTAAFCRHAMGSETASCDYSDNKDEVLRDDATLAVVDDTWVLEDPATVCSQ